MKKEYTDTQFSIDVSKTGKFFATQKKSGLLGKKTDLELDLLFMMFHGKNGEDGTVSGLCQMLNVPYVASSLLGSATGMNKVAMKDLFKANDIPQVEYVVLHTLEDKKEVKQL
jgi:D-alanine-D-alanine ligase-like ATP-grasp enzyme